MAGVQDYNTTPSANTLINGIFIGEGCNASNLNDALRQLMADLAAAFSNQLAPHGAIQAYAGDTVPPGYLLCDGSAVSRATYTTLWTAIGTKWGAGDGSTTFNLPDLRGRAAIGAGLGTGLTNRALAASGGEEAHVLTVNEVPAQSASLTGTADSGGAHTHAITDTGHTHNFGVFISDASGAHAADGSGSQSNTIATDNATTGISINSSGAHTHSINASGTTNGGGQAHNNMQPFAVVNYIIKV